MTLNQPPMKIFCVRHCLQDSLKKNRKSDLQGNALKRNRDNGLCYVGCFDKIVLRIAAYRFRQHRQPELQRAEQLTRNIIFVSVPCFIDRKTGNSFGKSECRGAPLYLL